MRLERRRRASDATPLSLSTFLWAFYYQTIVLVYACVWMVFGAPSWRVWLGITFSLGGPLTVIWLRHRGVSPR